MADINILEKIDTKSEDQIDLSEIEYEPEHDPSTNKKMCRLIKKHIGNFYDDIYVPYDFFRENEWDIIKSLYENTDSLFFSEDYIAESDKDRFFEVFVKYVTLIEPIFYLDSQLGIYLKSWSKKDNITYLKRILLEEKYKIISPLFIAELYKKKYTKYKTNKELLDQKFKKCLDKIILEFDKELKQFDKNYQEIIDSYVYEYPLDMKPDSDTSYVKGFINSIILIILDFSEKLIELKIYAIHTIIIDIINYYVPLDDINSFNSEDYRHKNLIII